MLAASDSWRPHLEEVLDLPLVINNYIVILFSIIVPKCLQMMKYALKIENKKSSINQSIFLKTRMHSSRMRTGLSLTACCSLLPRECLLPGGSILWGGCLLPGGLLWGGVCSGGVCITACTEADTLPLFGQTHACENITLAQLRCGRFKLKKKTFFLCS